jgi:hypothetical protein
MIPDGNISSSLVVFLAVVALIYYGVKILKLRYRPNINFTFLILFVGIFYFSERYSEGWEYYFLYKSPFALVDLYWLFLGAEISSWIVFLTIKHTPISINNKRFILDDPNENNDEFGRQVFASEICNYISNSFGQKSLAVGVSGSWGTGKSSLLCQIKNSFVEKKDDSIILIEFNPWRSATHNRIVEDFLISMKSSLSIYDKTLSGKFERYFKVLFETSKNSWVDGLSKILSLSTDKTSNELYNDINKSLELVGRKLVIFIDDLDRLHQEEIIEIFRIIRNTANFRNTCFVVAYDRNYVQSLLFSVNSQMSNYIDKIFQSEFVLPSVDPAILIEILVSEIERKIDEKFVGRLTKKSISDSGLYPVIIDFIKHKRDAIRFANIFNFDFQSIQQDITLGDFLLVELLKMKYPSVYDLFLYRKGKNILLQYSKLNERTIYVTSKERIKEFFSKYKESLKGLYGIDHEIIEGLFLALFKVGNSKSVNSILYPLNFYKYFSLSVFGNDLEYREFENFINGKFEKLEDQFDDWISNSVSPKKLDLWFKGFGISEFENNSQITNYIYGLKRVCSIEKRDFPDSFYEALKTGGFVKDNFEKELAIKSGSNIENEGVSVLFPEGIDATLNSMFINYLHNDENRRSNFYSYEKSEELTSKNLVILLEKGSDFNLIMTSWKGIGKENAGNLEPNSISRLKDILVAHILENKESFLEYSKSKNLRERFSTSGEDTVDDVKQIFSVKYYSDALEKNKQKIIRNISFIREFYMHLGLSPDHFSLFLDFTIRFNVKRSKNLQEFNKNLMEYYPISKKEFGDFDIKVFEDINKRASDEIDKKDRALSDKKR